MLRTAKLLATAVCVIATISISTTLWARGDNGQGRSQGISQDRRDRGDAVQSQGRQGNSSATNVKSSRSDGENRSYNSNSRGSSASNSSRSDAGQGTPASQKSGSSSKSSVSSSNRAQSAPSVTSRTNSANSSDVLNNWERGPSSRVTTVTRSRPVNRSVEVSNRGPVRTTVSDTKSSSVSASKSKPTATVYSSRTNSSSSKGTSQAKNSERTRVVEPIASNTKVRTETKPLVIKNSGRGDRTEIVKNDTKKGDSAAKTPRQVSTDNRAEKGRTQVVKGDAKKGDSAARGDRQVRTEDRGGKVDSKTTTTKSLARDTRSSRDAGTYGRTRAPMAGVTAPMRGYSEKSGGATSVIRSHVVVNNNYGRRPSGDFHDGDSHNRPGGDFHNRPGGDFRGRPNGDFHDRPDSHDYHGPRYDRNGHWWRPAYDHGHHDNWSFSFGFYRPHYYFCHWAPVVYEPVYTPIWNPVLIYEPAVYQPAYTSSTYIAGDTVIYPSRRVIYYGHGPSYTVSYVYPQYHRRYMFVSVGGYWPGYTYSRYYWYGCHPYVWYGAAPTAYAIADTQVYTYGNSQGGALTPGTSVAGVEVPDYDGLIQAGQKIKMAAAAEPPTRPDEPSATDTLFDEAVTAFGKGDYNTAVEKLRTAVRMEPNDAVLPFAYAQALFATNEYEKAAAVVYTALTELYPNQPEVFYPRGMYTDENLLNSQIANLERAVLMDPANVQMQLLLGYHYLGIGQYDKAQTPLTVAQRDGRTNAPASALLALLEKAKTAQ